MSGAGPPEDLSFTDSLLSEGRLHVRPCSEVLGSGLRGQESARNGFSDTCEVSVFGGARRLSVVLPPTPTPPRLIAVLVLVGTDGASAQRLPRAASPAAFGTTRPPPPTPRRRPPPGCELGTSEPSSGAVGFSSNGVVAAGAPLGPLTQPGVFIFN